MVGIAESETLVHWLVPLGLIALRVGIALASLPAPFGEGSPITVRAALGVVIAFALCLPHGEWRSAREWEAIALVRAGFGEALVGAVIALTVRVTLAAAEVAGSMMSSAIGLDFATSVDPAFGEESTPPGRLLASLAVLIFFAFEGHHSFLEALAWSFDKAPPGQGFKAFHASGVLPLGSTLVAHGLRIASPVVATMFIVQVGSALVARAAPRVQLFALTFSFSVAAGLIALWLAAPSVATAVGVEIRHLPAALLKALGG